MKSSREDVVRRLSAPLATPTDLKPAATKDIAGAMNAILADVFALYLKTKNFHWHMSGLTSVTIICCSTNRRISCSG